MKFKNILNKPYKYKYLYKYNKYTTISNIFNNTTHNYFKFLYIVNISNKQLQKFSTNFSNNLYKFFLIINFLKLRVDIKLMQMGIIKTLRQARHIITYGKILINGKLNKSPNIKLQIGDCIQLIPMLYLKNLHYNLSLFKNYLFKYNKVTDITQKNILNINKHIFYIGIR